MNKTYTKRQRFALFVVPAVLTLALLAACAWGAAREREAESARVRLENQYREAFYRLISDTNDMTLALDKLRAANSNLQYVLHLSDVWRLSGSIGGTLSQIPAAMGETEELRRFISQAGDYARVLVRRALGGAPALPEDTAQLNDLRDACASLAERLQKRLETGEIPTEPPQEFYAAGGGENADEESLTKYPTLIYDGPFSDSTENFAAVGVTGEPLSEEAAREKALEFLGGGELSNVQQSDGEIPSYDFSGTDGKGRAVEISVTRTGGHTLWMMAEVEARETERPDESEVEACAGIALAFLKERGYENMTVSYAQFYDGVIVVNCAATQENVILYNDLVKVWVLREGRAVCGVDARNYLSRHTERELKSPLLSEEDARGSVPEALEAESVRLALIPSGGTGETLCYEVKGKIGDVSYIVYIDARTGAEAEIFEIIDSENGQLTV